MTDLGSSLIESYPTVLYLSKMFGLKIFEAVDVDRKTMKLCIHDGWLEACWNQVQEP